MSTDVRAAFEKYLSDRDEYGSHWEHWVEMLEELRGRTAGLLNAEADEMAMTSSLSEGVNALASALSFGPERNKIVVTDFDFPTTAQIWYAQEIRGAEVVRVPERDGYIPAEDFESVIDEDTLLVAVTHVCFHNGARLDIPAIAEIARKKIG